MHASLANNAMHECTFGLYDFGNIVLQNALCLACVVAIDVDCYC